jgi:hypothetical protein
LSAYAVVSPLSSIGDPTDKNCDRLPGDSDLRVFAGINLYVGIGLLRVKPPVCVIGIGYFLFTFVNSTVFYLAPGARNRMLSLMDAENSIFP